MRRSACVARPQWVNEDMVTLKHRYQTSINYEQMLICTCTISYNSVLDLFHIKGLPSLKDIYVETQRLPLARGKR